MIANKLKIKEVVKLPEWQKLRESLKGTWMLTPLQNVQKLREFLGSVQDSENDRLLIIYNYLIGSGFRIGVISHPAIHLLLDEVRTEWRRRKSYEIK